MGVLFCAGWWVGYVYCCVRGSVVGGGVVGGCGGGCGVCCSGCVVVWGLDVGSCVYGMSMRFADVLYVVGLSLVLAWDVMGWRQVGGGVPLWACALWVVEAVGAVSVMLGWC